MMIWTDRIKTQRGGFVITKSDRAEGMPEFYWWYQGQNTYVPNYEEMVGKLNIVVSALNSGSYSGIEPTEFCKEILG